MKERSEKLDVEGMTRQYTGFDMTLAHAPMSCPRNFHFVQHNILEPFPKEYLGTFDVVHLRLLIAALNKPEIEPAMENVIKLLSTQLLCNSAFSMKGNGSLLMTKQNLVAIYSGTTRLIIACVHSLPAKLTPKFGRTLANSVIWSDSIAIFLIQ
jgi:hypothetical protein